MRDIGNYTKWKASDYNSPFQHWTPPELLYPCEPSEKDALHALKSAFQPLPTYKAMEKSAIKPNALVSIKAPLPQRLIAFLENTAEKCTSPQTKHSQAGMQGARHWVQRLDTPEGMFRRLTDGYGVSLMFGERCHQYIRNSNNWRGVSGVLLDIDVFRDENHPDAPEPVYSQSELFDRYPLLPRICSYLIPSASSLYDGRPFKARGIVLFPIPVTDQRVYRGFGDILCGELDCIPANVTKNPVAVGFGNTHNAPQAHRNESPDAAWIASALETAESTVLSTAKQNNRAQKKKAERKAHYATQGGGSGGGENISAFIEQCNAVSEMVRVGMLTHGRGNEYRWHESGNDRSCEIFGDGVIQIFSHSMSAASPAAELEPVNVHRFYLYQLAGLDLAKEGDKPKCREYLFERGYGSDPKAFAKKQHKAKLQHTPEDTTEPAETLDENRANREIATDRFIEPDPTDTLHILLMKDSTGTGKSYTVMAKTHQHGKKTLAQLPHTELATQAVGLAFELGYKDPFHLLGREHNWDASRIESIPVAMRTKALFEKNNCIMVDEVRAYTDQRLAPRTYCEHKCPFRDGCLHLAQYEGLGHRDFLVSCTPNLLFDLDMRGYLQSLVTATAAPSDEELAINAMLGTESEPTPVFDFAILDDYSIDGLYSEKTFKQSEFKALQKAWSGTPTADFASLVLKAFKKKKPAKIVKALRKAFENTEEDHAEIAIALTQHARLGVLEYVDRPKASKESRRLLSETQVIYDDGGRHFVAVDDEAYTELREKNIPVVKPEKLSTQVIDERVRVPHAPVHALMAGVPLKDFTVWRAGTTPIELLDIFLSSIGNDKNAPIARTFLVGSKASEDSPDALLTFSIPPQAPVGLLPQIALLSATTDTNDTQRAFDKQDVTFSVHEGGSLEWADGVQVYQYTDARLTSASVFQYPLDADGKRKLQEQPIGLTPTAEKRLEKLNDWAKQVDGTTAFISFKEFTDDSIPLADVVNGFDIVTHFDKVAGLNFDGLKFLVVFGYPKVKHEVVMEQARRQYASDSEPLPKGSYEDLTETTEYAENGITITENRYIENRLEKVRHQLSTEKLDQAIGRARLPVWTDTNTLVFTDAPIGNITDRATLFSSSAFNLAEAPASLSNEMDKIAEAEASGDVQAVMETQAVGKSQAYELTKEIRTHQKNDRDARVITLHQKKVNASEIHRKTGISRATVNRIINNFIGDQKSSC